MLIAVDEAPHSALHSSSTLKEVVMARFQDQFSAGLTAVVGSIFLAGCADDAPTPLPSGTEDVADVSVAAEMGHPAFSAFDDLLQQEIDAGVRSGFVVMVNEGRKTIHQSALGMADIENETPMTLDTRFRIASMTKPVTTVALMMLVEEGKVSLDDPVSDYIAGFATTPVATDYTRNADGNFLTAPIETPMTIKQILTHTAGLGYLFDGETDLGKYYFENSLFVLDGNLGDRIDFLATLPLYEQPGEKWLYSYGTDVAGRIVEVASGTTLEDFFQTRIFEPLSMNDTLFVIEDEDLDGAAVVYSHNEAGTLVRSEGDGVNPNPNTTGLGWASGGGGLVSTAADYQKFCRMLLNGGEANGSRLLKDQTVALMLGSHVPAAARPADWLEQGISFGLGGWVKLANPADPADQSTTGHFGWGGYLDTIFMISKEDDFSYVLLAQREPGPNDRPSDAQDRIRAISFEYLAQ
ncbi:MAG: serine hydrolase domain-containing protein [Pseudomonadota bacterium]